MTPPTDYHDFKLIFKSDGEGFRTRLVCSPVTHEEYEERLRLPATVARDRPNERQDAEATGTALFEALFCGEIGDKYRQCLSHVRDQSHHGLRIRLAIFPRMDRAEKLLGKPWEDLYDPVEKRFLSRSRKTTLVRDPVRPLELRSPLYAPQLRVLLVGSDAGPEGAPQLRYDEEVERIRTAWKGKKLEVLERPTLSQIGQSLAEGDYHVFHLICHGGVEEGEGVVWLHDEKSGPRRIWASSLAEHLQESRNLRLVVLNGCSTADVSRSEPMRSVGLRLMDVGLPAVIAHQATIDNPAAVAFGVALHRELAAGTPVDAAVAVARREVDERNECFEEWNVPVLYLAAANGVIFEHTAPSNSRGQTAGAHGERECLRLAVRSFHHPFDSLWNECDRLLDLAPAFDGRRIRDKKDWNRTIQPKLEGFLRRHVTSQRPLELRLDAHLSIAFAAGYALETRGIDVTLRQATLDGFDYWKSGRGETSADNAWVINAEERKAEKDDVVLVVGVTHDNAKDVERHIQRRLRSQARLVLRAKTQKTGRGAIDDGAHAFALADTLTQDLRQRLDPQRRSRIHLFLAVPAGFAFFLGQLSHDLGRIRLYEFDYEGDRRYRRSIDLGKKVR